jgi:hypothetical protein
MGAPDFLAGRGIDGGDLIDVGAYITPSTKFGGAIVVIPT